MRFEKTCIAVAAGLLSINVHAAVCSVDMASEQQSIDGFGFSSAWCGQLSAAKNNALYDTLGMSLLRIRIDPTQYWGEETANAAAAHAHGATVLGSPWSPPAYMKDNTNVVHGSLLPAYYGAYASYLSNAVNSIGLDYVSIQNEPDMNPDYEGCVWTTNQLLTFCRDHAQNIGAPVVMPESLSFNDSYSDPTLNDATAASHIAIVGGHFYGSGNRVHQNALNKGKRVWMTEHYIDNARSDMGNCITIAKEISDAMNNRFHAYFWWWVADYDSNANLVDSNGTIFKNGYTIGQFAKWIRPGSVRVAADYNPSSGIYVTAYRVEGETVIVALNTGTNAAIQQFFIMNGDAAAFEGYRTSASESMADIGGFTVRSGGFAARLPARSVTTFVQSGRAGVVFYQDENFGGSAGQPLAAGSYTASQLASMGVSGNWASSVQIPYGWTATLYADDNFGGTSWTLDSDTAALGALVPDANDQMSSCIVQSGPASAVLSGAIIGTEGSWNNSGNTIAKVFDGNLGTYFDGPVSNGCWAGLDFGTGASNSISQIKYCPRSGFASRMTNGVFQGANQPDFSNAVVLATVGSTPATGVLTTVTPTVTNAFRYVRYLSPDNGYGNVAEVQFLHFEPQVAPPEIPAGLAALRSGQQVQLEWTASGGAVSYNVKRATVSGGPYTTIANQTATAFTDANPVVGDSCFYVVSAVNDGGESGHSAEVSVLPHPWETQDVGATGLAGSAYTSGGTFTLTGSGSDIWDTADAFRYVYTQVAGNCTLVARVASVDYTDSWAKGGIMIRSSLAAGAPNAFICTTPGNGISFQWRSTTDGTSGYSNTSGLAAPYWVKLVRSGNSFTAYRSANGTSWAQQGTAQTISMGTTVYIGLAATAHNNSALCVATFDHVSGFVQPPAAPAGLEAVAVSDSRIDLSWTASAGAERYIVKRSTTSGSAYEAVASNVVSTSCSDVAGLVAGVRYYYVVSAVNAGGASGNSGEAHAVPSAEIASGEYYIAGHAVASGTNLNLVVSNSVPGHTYRIWATDSLVDPDWQPLGTGLAGTGSTLDFGVAIEGASTNRYFKLDVQRQ
jgi:glucuronoarabinoxylan endo-1,4-beta-xylanase